jgi:hypothetical protein
VRGEVLVLREPGESSIGSLSLSIVMTEPLPRFRLLVIMRGGVELGESWVRAG